MRHQRLSVSALVTLIVTLVTTGSSFATTRSHDGRRRNAPLRIARGSAQRLDTADAVHHESDHHDPVIATTAAGVPVVGTLDAPARPFAPRQRPAGPRADVGIVTPSFASVSRLDSHARWQGSAPTDVLMCTVRPSLGRAPPTA